MFTRIGSISLFSLAAALPIAAETVYVDQGGAWTPSLRTAFYTQDQGSRIMPLSWMQALTTADGEPFLHGSLARYGYLPMPDRADDPTLPVGFTTNNWGGETAIGMTCAACHVREIEVDGTAYRLDGGPSIVDFQSFLKDLDDAVLAVLGSDEAFAAFANAVLGNGAAPSSVTALKAEVEIWSNRYHTLMDRSLPDPAWAPGRLDAVSMIFNRLTGLDIGPDSDDGIIADNIIVADAPTRYPFLWNAAKQDYTQWPGFAQNGNDLFGLSRNLGEVYGVFGDFRPTPKEGFLFNVDYLSENSANWEGLKALEDWIWDIGAPVWPWDIDADLAKTGEDIFNLSTDAGGCVACHGKKDGEFRSLFHKTYATPILDVGTDRRECEILGTTVKTGVLEGAKVPFVGDALGAEATAFDVLARSVIGAIIQHGTSLRSDDDRAAMLAAVATTGTSDDAVAFSEFKDLAEAFPSTDDLTPFMASADDAPCKYEARVLDGIWAAAPYLHNGSVPTLADLLEKPEDRPASFVPGPAYDLDKVGMAVDQTAFDQVIATTGCDDLSSGNSNCGHTYGTDLSDTQKAALLEYLKSI